MKIISANFNFLNSYLCTRVDEHRVEYEIDEEELLEYEEGCGALLLEWVEYEGFDKPLLVHQSYDTVTDFFEVDDTYQFYIGGRFYIVPNNGEPKFYKLYQ